jgi:glucose-6-phosphate 1-dehydrogenase
MATAATANRQEEHEQIGKAAGPCDGAVRGFGDLTKRKLVPALYNLASETAPRNFAVVGYPSMTLAWKSFATR